MKADDDVRLKCTISHLPCLYSAEVGWIASLWDDKSHTFVCRWRRCEYPDDVYESAEANQQ